MDHFQGKRIVVMGLGRFGGGLDSAVFACRAGGRVTVTDLANKDDLTDALKKLEGLDIKFHLGSHIDSDFTLVSNDIVIVNPAVAPDNRYLAIARSQGLEITSQIEIFFKLCPAKIVGITGANGKSTTTALTAHLLENGLKGKCRVWLGGNIGNRPLLELLDEIDSNDVVVLELSSFQLEQLERGKRAPRVSLITNLTENHLDRHGTFQAYCRAKENIFLYQKLNNDDPCISIFNAEDEITESWYQKYSKQDGRKSILFHADDIPEEITENFALPGRANRSNLSAAMKAAYQFGLSDLQIENAVSTFKPLAHRLELVADINGVKWYNDSIATTPVSSIAALQAFKQPKIIIAGGYDKNLPFDELGTEIAKNARAAVLIGKTANKIAESIQKAPQDSITDIVFADSMEDAVKKSADLARQGDVVLMSPACASYDMFDNFQCRAEAFIKSVRAIK